MAGRTFRFTIENAGLIVLQCGGRHDGVLTTSNLGWFAKALQLHRAGVVLKDRARGPETFTV